MKFTLMVGFYLIVSTKLVESADVRNVTSGVTWFEAVSQCGSNGLEYNLTILSGLEQLYDNPFWIGLIRYRVMTPWMYPLGCYYVHDRQYQRITSSLETIGHCQQYCNSSITFGYQNPVCQCLNNDDLSNMSKTNLSDCTSNKTDVFMIYSVFNYRVSNGNQCMLSLCDDGHIKHMPQDCRQRNNNVAVVCDDTYRPNSTVLVWAVEYEKAKVICMLENKLLLSPYHCPRLPGINAWTSAFREQLILEAVGASNVSMTTPIDCMSGIRDVTETNSVHVITRSCSDLLTMFVCMSSMFTINLSTTGATIVEESIDTTKNHVNISTTGPTFGKKTTFALENHGAMIGGIIGGVAAILLVVALLVWIWWRQRNKDSTSKEVNVSTNPPTSVAVYQNSNIQYEEPISGADRTTEDGYTMLTIDNKPQQGEYSTLNATTEEQSRTNEAGYTMLNMENKPQGEYMTISATTDKRTATTEEVYVNA